MKCVACGAEIGYPRLDKTIHKCKRERANPSREFSDNVAGYRPSVASRFKDAELMHLTDELVEPQFTRHPTGCTLWPRAVAALVRDVPVGAPVDPIPTREGPGVVVGLVEIGKAHRRKGHRP